MRSRAQFGIAEQRGSFFAIVRCSPRELIGGLENLERATCPDTAHDSRLRRMSPPIALPVSLSDSPPAEELPRISRANAPPCGKDVMPCPRGRERAPVRARFLRPPVYLSLRITVNTMPAPGGIEPQGGSGTIGKGVLSMAAYELRVNWLKTKDSRSICGKSGKFYTVSG